MKTFAVAVVCAAALALVPVAMAKAPGGVPHSGSYSAARKILLKGGWKPVHQPDPGFKCPPGDERCEGRPETVDCAGTGLGNCIFRWKRKGVVVDVMTAGETDPQINGVRCKKGCR